MNQNEQILSILEYFYDINHELVDNDTEEIIPGINLKTLKILTDKYKNQD